MIRSRHQGCLRIWRTQTSDVFQSSWTSWSSKIIVRRDRRQQPPHERRAPGLPVQVAVLLEVGDIGERRVVAIRGARLDVPPRRRRHLVGVDLVAEQHEQVGPVGRVGRAHADPEREERIDLAALLVLVLRERPGRRVRRGDAARAEGDPQRHRPRPACGWCSRSRRPLPRASTRVAVQGDRVRVGRPGLETLDDDEREVVAARRERRGGAAEDLDLARAVGLHPDGGVPLADVAQERTEEQLGRCHGVELP